MAKKVKFPLKMADNTQVRTLEELRERFDLASVLSYYDDGRLAEWLSDRYYEEEANKIKELNSSSDSFKKQLCDILGVCYSENEVNNIDFIDISSRNERRERLKRFTADDKILEAVDNVVFSQEELEDYLNKNRVPKDDVFGTASVALGNISAAPISTAPISLENVLRRMIKGMDVIYLCGERFIIPMDLYGVTFVGVNNPEVEAPAGFSNRHITFEKVSLDLDVEGIIQCAKEATDPVEALKYWRIAAEEGSAEAQFQIGIAPFAGVLVNDFGEAQKEGFKWLLEAAEQGHIEAQLAVARTYRYENILVDMSYEKATTWLLKAVLLEPNIEAVEGHIASVIGGANEDDEDKIFYWIRKFAEEGSSVAQFALGICEHNDYPYYWTGVNEGAEYWFRKAADQGYDKALSMLEEYGES